MAHILSTGMKAGIVGRERRGRRKGGITLAFFLPFLPLFPWKALPVPVGTVAKSSIIGLWPGTGPDTPGELSLGSKLSRIVDNDDDDPSHGSHDGGDDDNDDDDDDDDDGHDDSDDSHDDDYNDYDQTWLISVQCMSGNTSRPCALYELTFTVSLL